MAEESGMRGDTQLRNRPFDTSQVYTKIPFETEGYWGRSALQGWFVPFTLCCDSGYLLGAKRAWAGSEGRSLRVSAVVQPKWTLHHQGGGSLG